MGKNFNGFDHLFILKLKNYKTLFLSFLSRIFNILNNKNSKKIFY